MDLKVHTGLEQVLWLHEGYTSQQTPPKHIKANPSTTSSQNDRHTWVAGGQVGVVAQFIAFSCPRQNFLRSTSLGAYSQNGHARQTNSLLFQVTLEESQVHTFLNRHNTTPTMMVSTPPSTVLRMISVPCRKPMEQHDQISTVHPRMSS